MNTVETVKAICKERHIPISRLEKECGFANGYIRRLSKGTFPNDRLYKIADFLCVSPDYLMGVQENVPPFGYYLNPKTVMKARQLYLEGIVFDAGRNATPEELEMVAQMIRTLKDKNEDG